MSAYPMSRVYDDLDWLREHGALAGVGEIIHERRRQIEDEGRTPDYDRQHHTAGELAMKASARAATAVRAADEPTCGPAEVSVYMAQSGALAAAEIDRLAGESG